MGAFLTDEGGPVLDRIAAHVAAVPQRSEVGCYAKLRETVQVRVILDPQMGAGDLIILSS